MFSNRKLIWTAAVLVCAAAAWLAFQRWYPWDDKSITALESVTTDYRRIIVLMNGSENLPEPLLVRCRAVGRQIFWRKQETLESFAGKLHADQLRRYLTRAGLRDADKLAFLDLVEELADR